MKSLHVYLFLSATLLFSGCLKDTKQSEDDSTSEEVKVLMTNLTGKVWVGDCEYVDTYYQRRELTFSNAEYTEKAFFYSDSSCDTEPYSKTFDAGTYTLLLADSNEKNHPTYTIEFESFVGTLEVDRISLMDNLLYLGKTEKDEVSINFSMIFQAASNCAFAQQESTNL